MRLDEKFELLTLPSSNCSHVKVIETESVSVADAVNIYAVPTGINVLLPANTCGLKFVLSSIF